MDKSTKSNTNTISTANTTTCIAASGNFNDVLPKYYNWISIAIVTSIEILIIFSICIFVVPYLVELLVDFLKNAYELENDDNIAGYLGGFSGVILGFIFDLILIKKIRNLFRYHALISSITNELNIFIDTFKYFEEKHANYKCGLNTLCVEAYKQANKKLTTHDFNFEKSHEFLGAWSEAHCFIRLPIIEGTILTSDSINLLSKLPQYFLIGDLFCKGSGQLSDYLYNLFGAVKRYNEVFDKHLKIDELETIWFYVERFFITTKHKHYEG